MMKHNKTKRKIFTAALELFAQKGYPEVSIRDIAEKVNIKAASIYYHYSSKEEILTDILNFYEERMEFYWREMSELNLNELTIEEYPLKMHIYYKPEEALLMFMAGHVVINEQFRNYQSAELLLGSGFERYINIYEKFIKSVSERMEISGDNCRKYAEIFARVSLVFMMQFQHTDMFRAYP